MHDNVSFRQEKYFLVSCDPKVIFNPNNLGITTYGRNTACWRGFLLNYCIKNDKLFLESVLLNTKDEPPKINGRTPTKEISYFDYNYYELEYELGFSGTLVIAKDLIKELYVHGGFQAPTSFETVFRLTFENDILLKVDDISSLMKESREKPPTDPNNLLEKK